MLRGSLSSSYCNNKNTSLPPKDECLEANSAPVGRTRAKKNGE